MERQPQPAPRSGKTGAADPSLLETSHGGPNPAATAAPAERESTSFGERTESRRQLRGDSHGGAVVPLSRGTLSSSPPKAAAPSKDPEGLALQAITCDLMTRCRKRGWHSEADMAKVIYLQIGRHLHGR